MKKTNLALIWLALLLLFVAAMMWLVSCSSSEHTVKSRTTVDSSVINERDQKIIELQTDTAEYRRQIREMEYLTVTFNQQPCDTGALRAWFAGTDCPPARVDSFIKYIAVAPPVVKKNADGSLELTGVKSLTQSRNILTQENATLRSTVAKLIEESVRSAARVTTVTTTKEKASKTKFLTGIWWLWLMIGFGCGIAFKNRIPFLKNVSL